MVRKPIRQFAAHDPIARSIPVGLLLISLHFAPGCSKNPGGSADSIIVSGNIAYYAGDDPSIAIPVDTEDNAKTSPKPLHPFQPDYPDKAKEERIEGVVYVRLLVMKDGSVKRAIISSSPDTTLNKAALRAAMRWNFSPGRYPNGSSYNTYVAVPFHFVLTR